MDEVKRKLASIRTISEIKPIEGADSIELATVDGWQCVVKKGEFTPGMECIYFEIDSFLPIKDEYEFLRKSSYKKMGDKEWFRLKTIRLRGQISQGLVIPFNREEFKGHWRCGDDLTETLGVLKYDPPLPACLSGLAKGNFPSFLKKTDQERVQNIWNQIKDCDEEFEVTIKLDGTSCTYYLKDGVFGVCSRNLELKEDYNNTFWRLAKENDIENKLRSYGKNIALQGEVIGEGIQGNPEVIKGQHFYLFDIWDIDNYKYYSPNIRWQLQEFSKINAIPAYLSDDTTFSIDIPNNLRHFKLNEFKKIDDILQFANGPSLHSSMREGVVFKSMTSQLSFKIISNDYLLQQK